MRLTTDLRVQLSGVVPLVPVYAFMACIGTTLPLALTRGLLCSDVIYTSEIDLLIFNNSLIIFNLNVPV